MHTLKIGFVGDCNVGKSSLLVNFLNKPSLIPNNNGKSTMGVDYEVYTPADNLSSRSHPIQLWDVSGSDSSGILARGLFPHLDALVLVFDVTDPQTLESCCSSWLHEVRRLSKNVTKLHRRTMLLGNKIDRHVFDHSVSVEEQHRVADRYDIPFSVRASAKTGLGVTDGLTALIDALLSEKQLDEEEISLGFACLPTGLFASTSMDSQLKLHEASGARAKHRFADPLSTLRTGTQTSLADGFNQSLGGRSTSGVTVSSFSVVDRPHSDPLDARVSKGSGDAGSLSASSVTTQESDFLLAPFNSSPRSVDRLYSDLWLPRSPVSPYTPAGRPTKSTGGTDPDWTRHFPYASIAPDTSAARALTPNMSSMK